MPIKRKAAAAEPAGESAPMWIVSFADLVTLMMSFFVVLYALKQGGAAQQLETAAAIKLQFGWIPDRFSDSALDRVGRKRIGMESTPFEDYAGNVTKPMDGASGSQTDVTSIRPAKTIVTGGQLSFDLGQSTLNAESKNTLEQIAKRLKGLNNVLMVKGHVSNDEISTLVDDPNGMALSYRRAIVVCDELVRLGINRNVLRPVGCGPFEPLQTGVYNDEGHRLNRRAEVLTTDNSASEYFPLQTVPPATTEPTTMKTHED
ncbi:MAG: OmpA family protein [Phycisphaerales bacterium]|nr:OmpA family protein [Phycisphaerales bacterium]